MLETNYFDSQNLITNDNDQFRTCLISCLDLFSLFLVLDHHEHVWTPQHLICKENFVIIDFYQLKLFLSITSIKLFSNFHKLY